MTALNDPYEGLTPDERSVVLLIAESLGPHGMVGPHNHVHPRMARRVFDALQRRELLAESADKQPHRSGGD